MQQNIIIILPQCLCEYKMVCDSRREVLINVNVSVYVLVGVIQLKMYLVSQQSSNVYNAKLQTGVSCWSHSIPQMKQQFIKMWRKLQLVKTWVQ